jgi:ring-1,2-phenylacetyl-CoA epoxidase subunit PaaD
VTAATTAYELVAALPDPELPMVTIAELGILRDVREIADEDRVTVTITPTYSGCPALEAIRRDIERTLRDAGWARVEVETGLSPAWTTDWITEDGRRKLAEHGIAPPPATEMVHGPVELTLSIRCPQCGSLDTQEISRFGSTPCKSLYVCSSCCEPFEFVKPL